MDMLNTKKTRALGDESGLRPLGVNQGTRSTVPCLAGRLGDTPHTSNPQYR